MLPPSFYNQTDQDIYNAGNFFIPQERFRSVPFNLNTPSNTTPAPPAGLPSIYQSQSGGALQAGDINYDSFAKAGFDAYANRQPTPLVNDLYQSKLDKTFMGFPSYKQVDQIGPFTPYNQPMDMEDPAASIENIIASRNVPLELTTAGKIQNTLGNVTGGIQDLVGKVGGIGPISMLLGSMDKFNTLPALDQQFIKQSMGYRGPTVFGENTGGGYVDPFGVNVRSAFGNYAEKVRDDFSGLGDSLSGRLSEKYGATFNPETGMFESEDEEAAAKANKMTKMMRAKYNFRQKQIKQQEFDKEIADSQKKTGGGQTPPPNNNPNQDHDGDGVPNNVEAAGGSYDGGYHGAEGGFENTGSGGGYQGGGGGASYSSSASTGAKDGFGYGLADGGRVYYMNGGLADLVDIYD